MNGFLLKKVQKVINNTAKGKSVLGSLLEQGDSPVMQIIGDSTGNDTNEWVYLLGQKIAQKYPDVNVKYRRFEIDTSKYNKWTNIQVAGEDRHIYESSAGQLYFIPDSEVVKTSPDLDIEIRCALDDWQQSGNPYILTKMNGPGHYCWGVLILSNKVTLYWSEDGTNLKTFNTNIDTTDFVDGSDKWFKVTLDVDNGAAGYTATSYTSTDGYAWTQVNTSTVAGVTSIFEDATVTYKLAGRDTGASKAYGKFYEVILRDGIDGANILPQPIEAFRTYSSTEPGVIAGTPTVYIYNASISGSGVVSNWNNEEYVKRRIPITYGAMLFISLGHNEGNQRDSQYLTALDGFFGYVDARVRAADKFLITQNPITLSTVYPFDRRLRRRILMGYAKSKGMTVIDTYLEFLKDPRGFSALLSDELHPNLDGQKLWADTVWKQLGLYN